MALVNVENLLLNISESAYILRLGGICGKQRSSQHKRQSTLVSHANARVNRSTLMILFWLCINHAKKSSTIKTSSILCVAITQHDKTITSIFVIYLTIPTLRLHHQTSRLKLCRIKIN